MKRKLVVYLAGLLTVLSVGFGSAQFSDVPAGHWAKEAVEKIAACGLITGFPDGTFRGNQNLTRYQAALIFQRLLDELNNGGQCVKKDGSGLSADDLTAIRNATQELAAELAALGVRVSALEDNAASKDDIAALQAALDEVKAAQDAMMSAEPATPEAPAVDENAATQDDIAALQAQIDDLQSQIDAAASAEPAAPEVPAVDENAATQDDVATLQASIDSLQAQIDAMQADQEAAANAEPAAPAADTGMDAQALADLQDRVEAASVAADTALAQTEQLANRLDDAEGRLDGVEGGLAALQTQADADGDSIRALNELAVLLNQDVLSLQDRTTALEKSLADVDFESFASKEDVSAIQEFATALRSDLVKLSDRVGTLEGSISTLTGRVGILERNAFSIDGSVALTYLVKRAWGFDTDGATAGVQNQLFDIDRVFAGTTFSTGDDDDSGLTFDDPADRDLGQLVEGDTTAKVTVNFRTGKFDGTSSPGKFNSYPAIVGFYLQAVITGNYNNNLAAEDDNAPVNAYLSTISTTLAVANGQALNFSFGVKPVAKFTEYVFDNNASSRGPGFVANLPFPILGGTTTVVYGSTRGTTVVDNKYFRGIRSSFGLGPINLGASFVQEGVDQVPGNGAEVKPITVGGFDASATLGPIALSGEYFTTDGAAAGNTGLYVKADTSLGIIKLGASFRNIGAGITPTTMLSRDATLDNGGAWNALNEGNNAAPFKADQNGFGVTAGLSLGPIGIDGYFQNYTLVGVAKSAFGVTASTTLGPIALSAWFKQATSAGAAADSIANEKPGDGTYTTALGVKAVITNLIPNLTLTAQFENRSVTGISTITVYGDFSLNAGPISAKLLGRFVSANPGTTSTKYGVQLSTQPLFAGISLFADGVAASKSGGSTTEGLARAGIKASNLLVNNSSLQVSYGGYGGQNLSSITLGDQSNAFNSADGDIYAAAGANSGELKGIFVEWSYWDLVFSYADFDLNNNGNKTHAQAFKIKYVVNF